MNQLNLCHFDGITYDHRLARARLAGQLLRVFELMRDGKWRTLRQIQEYAGGSESGASARIRDLRKPRFGAYTVERRRRTAGIWEYRLIT